MSSTAPLPNMKIGLYLPVTEREMGGLSARWSDLLMMAQHAEALGFDSIWIEDHLLFRFSDSHTQGPWECWSILAALAAVTSQIELGSLVSCTSFRNPALLAKMADTIDEISSGRFILGLGAGWHEPEYAAFGYPFDHRVSRFEEAITIIHGLLRHGSIDFAGQYYSARDCELRPRSARSGGPPIMIGSTGERMLGLIARFGDIWNVWARQSIEELETDRAQVDTAMTNHGRDPRTLAHSACLLLDLPMRVGRPSEPRAGIIVASQDELRTLLQQYGDAGVSHLQLWIDPNTIEGMEWVARVIAR